MSDNTPTRSHGLPLRFSLRVLLVAFTLFAIGFPIWYRWPYEEEDKGLALERARGSTNAKRISTWQRQWGGGRKKHGPEWEYSNGRLYSITTYRDGNVTGPFTRYWLNHGKVASVGSHQNGVPIGTWHYFNLQGRESGSEEYRGGRLWRLTITADGSVQQVEFDEMRHPTRIIIDGHEVEDRLARLATAGHFDDPQVRLQLGKHTVMEFVETPLQDAIDFLASQHGIPMVVDSEKVDAELPITENPNGLLLSTALTLMLRSRNLDCDYRYGCLWITSAEDAENWRDPTGVADIVPPADSQLARSWNEAVAVEAIDRPLAEALIGAVERLAVTVDTSRISPRRDGHSSYPVTVNLSGLPFKHVLGQLLYRTRCRAKLDGETLVILPPEDSP
jgi:hypothetical protein